MSAAMFALGDGDCSSSEVGFSSSWLRQKATKSSSAQTSTIQLDESEAQTKRSAFKSDVSQRDSAAQTEANIQEIPPSSKVGDEIIFGSSKQASSASLLSFLTRVAPTIETAIQRNLQSHAFDGFDVSWDEDRDSVTCSHTLAHDFADDSSDLQCTNVAWNSSGSIIAASFGRLDHFGWCGHKGYVCAWNLSRRSLNPTKADIAIDLSSCCMCLAFHPEQPSLLVGGTYNGEIVVWDVSQSEQDSPLIAASRIGEHTHTEPVSQVAWILNRRDMSYLIASTSGDSKILLWSLKNKLEQPVAVCTLSDVDASGSQSSIPLTGGCTSFSFSSLAAASSSASAAASPDSSSSVLRARKEAPGLENALVVGTEGGHLLKCSLVSCSSVIASNLKRAGSDGVSLVPKNPVTFTYDGHIGPVSAVSCSPFHRNVFVSCGSDGVFQLYNGLQSRPLMTAQTPSSSPLLCCSWSPIRPLVFAGTDERGFLYIFDLEQNAYNPVVCIDTREVNKNQSGGVSGGGNKIVGSSSSSSSGSGASRMPSMHGIMSNAVYALAFNQQNTSLLATGDAKGVVRVWQLNRHLSQTRPREMALLSSLAESGPGLLGLQGGLAL